MAKHKHQGDIVSEFLAKDAASEHTDEVYIPGLASHFEEVPVNAKEKSAQWRVPGLQKIAIRPRQEIAETLASVRDFKPGVTGFKWVVGENELEVRYVDGFKQKLPEHEGEEDDFLDVLVTILKARRDITALDWSFGSDHVNLTYRP